MVTRNKLYFCLALFNICKRGSLKCAYVPKICMIIVIHIIQRNNQCILLNISYLTQGLFNIRKKCAYVLNNVCVCLKAL